MASLRGKVGQHWALQTSRHAWGEGLHVTACGHLPPQHRTPVVLPLPPPPLLLLPALPLPTAPDTKRTTRPLPPGTGHRQSDPALSPNSLYGPSPTSEGLKMMFLAD